MKRSYTILICLIMSVLDPQNVLAFSSAHVNDAMEVLMNEGSASVNGPRTIILSKEKELTTRESRSVEGNIPPIKLCPLGSGFSETGCIICRVGEYSNSRSGYCVKCPPGTYGDLPEAAQCTICPANTASSDYGSTICPPCGHPAHSTIYCDGPSAAPTSPPPTSAPTCPPGYGISEKGTCVQCLRGQYASPKSGYCVECPPGTYNNNPGATECTRCSPTSVCAVYGCTRCIQCEHDAHSPTACDPPPTSMPTMKPSAVFTSQPPTAKPTCPPGHGIFEKGTCRLCGQGEYLDRSGYCVDCRPGYYNNLSGQYMCKRCSRTSICPIYHCINCTECGYDAYSPTACNPPPSPNPTSKSSSSKPTARPSKSKKPISKPSRKPVRRHRSSKFPIEIYDGITPPIEEVGIDDATALQ